jgi:hypothetical protein
MKNGWKIIRLAQKLYDQVLYRLQVDDFYNQALCKRFLFLILKSFNFYIVIRKF